jgi:hypothetical protein
MAVPKLSYNMQVFDVERDFVLDPAFSFRARQIEAANFAQNEFRIAQNTNRVATGRVPQHTQAVDGRAGAAFDTVNPDKGLIAVEFQLSDAIFDWLDRALMMASPVRTGRYQKSHRFFADGVPFDPRAGTAPDAMEYVVLNIQPYARKIEGGKGRPPLSKQAPSGVYQVVAELAKRRFGKSGTRISFGYRAISSGMATKVKDERQPAIIVKI